MSSSQAIISEIFQSIQGEGIYVGERQVFVRLYGCNLSCEYCDTIGSKSEIPPDRIGTKSGTNPKCVVKYFQETEHVDNPLSLEKVQSIIDRFISKQELYHSITFTGGEPLLQVDFLKDLLPKIKFKKYLETNGTFPERLSEIIDFIDIIAMDYKLPSATRTGAYFDEHKKFIKIGRKKELFIKAVFSKETTAKEVEEMSQAIADEDPLIPLILQPVTPSRHFKSKPTGAQCLSFQAIAKRKLQRVLVIPQVHKILEVD